MVLERGPDVHGQILVLYDVIGVTPGKLPRFAMNFAEPGRAPGDAVRAYVDAVRDGSYPTAEHCFTYGLDLLRQSPLKIAKTAKELGEIVDGWRKQAETVGFVPTMGNLHAGHMRFVGALRSAGATRIVSSIFVNPTQFGPNEDFATYPRTFDDDCRRLEAANVDLLFAPDVGEIYPESGRPTVEINIAGLSSELCGAFRPGHFVGVLTVVAKLLNLTRPHLAAFGEKDYQQLVMITWMVESLCFPVQIVPVATVREEDGLALSRAINTSHSKSGGLRPSCVRCCLKRGRCSKVVRQLPILSALVRISWQKEVLQ